ncbi:pyridoxamine 5'-phosphate oxidase family protein [Brevundimonas diminuta]|uniref:pyridoxamine 5'-phosphate oxidase family protein n=1 Tax=Brevundimonas diminuta TaxID=293 RepID=UPI0022B0686B|nr:pyridoxamine 5'-phosphate oxidase family protein [Brevundimonas diminuta]MCZ4107007.1 pyridoxamine 5'-phosphate oxidase family protein [Brevundimonas diminuta]
MSGSAITTVAELEGVIGKTPPPMHLKVIDHLDAGALRWISASPLMFAGFGDGSGVGVTLAGSAPGFASGDARELRVPLALLDDPALVQASTAFGSLFLLPGIGETLRVNGQVAAVDAGQVRIAVDECYGHCAKALIRSELWAAQPAQALDDPTAFVASSRFLALATIGADGRADLSPKGDPAGCMAQLDGDVLWFADRPGNRRVDSFRNIVEQPDIAMALLIPGANRIAIVRGQARLTTDAAARERFTVKDKTPLLAIAVAIETLDLRDSPALARADLWPVHATSDIDPAKLFVEHIKLNKIGGVAATLARASLSVPGMTGLLKKGLDKDYKDNLY